MACYRFVKFFLQVEESGREKTGKSKLWSWLNGSLKIKMTDGRVLVGNFFCTDRDSNVILGSSGEYLKEEDVGVEQPRVLGLVMVPGRHIVSIHYLSDTNKYSFD